MELKSNSQRIVANEIEINPAYIKMFAILLLILFYLNQLIDL